jgi:hypothetical protein
MKNFFIGKHFMGDVCECVMIDNPDRGTLHFLSTKKELDHYVLMNGGKVYFKSNYETEEVIKTNDN